MMMLGFGVGEEQRERELAGAIALEGMKAVESRLHDEAARYKRMGRNEAPERYTEIYATDYSPSDGKTITEIVFHHINRRHPFSPDGWALMGTRGVLVIDGGNWTYFKADASGAVSAPEEEGDK